LKLPMPEADPHWCIERGPLTEGSGFTTMLKAPTAVQPAAFSITNQICSGVAVLA
jgi:hypothetical protein